jgi:glucokinase-like ROK family protein
MKRNSIDHATMRDMNLTLILSTLRQHAPLSRSQLAAHTGLNKATVSSIVKELLASELVYELGSTNGTSEVGRPATNLQLNPDAGYIIGVEIGVDFISIIIANFAIGVVSRRYESTVNRYDQQDILDRLLYLLKESVVQVELRGRPLFGIGLGVPGLVDVSSGTLLFAPNLQWSNLPLRQFVANEFDVPVYVGNEANMAALGESYFGAGQHCSYMLYVSSGIGLGGGIVIDGQLVEGATGFAGEAGHMTVQRDGLLCNCGNRGCWETLAGQRALFRRILGPIEAGEASWIGQITGGDPEKLSIALIVEAARKNDAVACQALKETGEWLGLGIASLMNIMNPQLVVFGGPLSLAHEFLLPQIKETVSWRAWDWVHQQADIVIAAHGEDAAVIGAVAMVYRDVLNKPRMWL